ncbi:hypothetical protein JZ751_026334 [Albula glossodonta]|uniref:Peptidase metallopeptidase domain-containing protein n=1 Tax=Albula glossodonta TaxID=121402 RepID=A0A8T2PFN3_9TELE|nr:hypothetical protein JZ751_026334 [Albula glossodonta]
MVHEALCLATTMIVFISLGLSSPVPDRFSRGVDWLSRYGYLPPPDARTGRLQTREGIEKGIREMQRFAGLKETGKLDEATLALMSTPRCSLPDIVGPEDKLKRRRRKRYALSGLRWDKLDITWSVHGIPSLRSNTLSHELVDTILTYALKVWSDVTPLRFRKASVNDGGGKGQGGDIRISFSKSFHDDGYPFDGKGGTLAHAFFPGKGDISGDTHFDDDEIWSYGDDSDSTDLFTVAVHEFGHALGLSHSSSDPSIMRPYYQGSVGAIRTYKLPMDDTQAIQTLYGKEQVTGGRHTMARLPVYGSPNRSLPSRCNGSFDAVANIRGEVFFFKGPYFWRIQRSGSLVSLSPALVQNFWIGLPPGTKKIDAVYERRSDSHIIFFIGNQYWVFKDRRSLPGYPRPLSDWKMRGKDGKDAERVEAAFVWAHNGKTYLFSGGEFWRFDEGGKQVGTKPEGDYPKQATLWGGVPPDPDDIISWEKGDAYFFKGNSYWVVKSGGMDQDTVTPKSTAVDWLRCAPTPTPARPRDRDCSCALSRAVSCNNSLWNILLFTTLIFLSFSFIS